MTLQNGTNFNSSDLTVASAAFELSESVAKSIVADTDSTTPTSNVFSVSGADGISTSGAGSTITIDGSAIATGDWELITSTTANNDASICFTDLSSSYYVYLFVIDALVPFTDNVALYVRTSTDNGSSYDSGAGNYIYNSGYITSAARGGAATSLSATQMQISNNIGSDANEQEFIMLYLYNPSSTQYTFIDWISFYTYSDGTFMSINGTGHRLSAADVDAIQFLYSSGNVESGFFKLYGLKAS